MNAKIVTSVLAAALACGCSAIPESSQSALAFAYGDGEDAGFPPQVVAGVTKFPETALPNNYAGGPRDPPPVIWVRFGVTQEAAERELAEASRLPKVATGAADPAR